MKTLGIVGGIGPESTIEYYRSIVGRFREAMGDGSSPSLVIRSIDVRVLLNLVAAGGKDETVKYLGDAIVSLAGAGANFAILAANTPHIVFDDLCKASPLPLLSIVSATREFVTGIRMNKLALIGTRFTMQADFYQKQFTKADIELVVPSDDEQEFIHQAYVGELLNGVFLDPTRERLFEIVRRLIHEDQIQGVILAGTELPLLLGNIREVEGIPLLDTTQIHVNAVVTELLR